MLKGKPINLDGSVAPVSGVMVKEGTNWRLRRYLGVYDWEWVLFVDRHGCTLMADFDHHPTNDELQMAIVTLRLEGQ